MLLTYRDAVDKLFSPADFERESRANQPPDCHVKGVHRLTEMLDAPPLATAVVDVAGAKGKGSASATVATPKTRPASAIRVGWIVRDRIRRARRQKGQTSSVASVTSANENVNPC